MSAAVLWTLVTLAAYAAALWLYRRSGHHLLCLPVLTGTALVLGALALAGTGYPVYAEGTRLLRWLTGPAIIALAVPLYQQAALLRRMALPLLGALLAGCLASVLGTLLLAQGLGSPMPFALSIAPKAATMPIAMQAAERAGGLPAVAALAVVRSRRVGHPVRGPGAAVAAAGRCDHAQLRAGPGGARHRHRARPADAPRQRGLRRAGDGPERRVHRTGDRAAGALVVTDPTMRPLRSADPLHDADPMSGARLTRYQQLAEEIADGIRAGLLRPGERLPSVRQTCEQRGVSPSTVFQAYGQLESQGLVEARARSGFFVRATRRPARSAPQAARPSGEATPVAISELVFELLGSTRDADVVPLGSAFPAPHLFPFDALARSGARAMRRLPAARITGALTAGDVGLRQAVRRRYALHGVPLAEDELVITNGAMEALNLCLQAVTQPGDVVVVESPTFYAALQALERLHLKAVEVATDPREGVDLDALAALLERQSVAACWFMPSFQNPLGALMPPSASRRWWPCWRATACR